MSPRFPALHVLSSALARLTAFCLVLCLVAAPALADPARISALLHNDRLFAILQSEGVQYGDDLAGELLASGPTPDWEAEVKTIHDPGRLLPVFDQVMARELAGADQKAIEGWLGSPAGQRVIKHELDARAAMLDSKVEDAAIARVEVAEAAHDPKLAAVRKIIAAADLIEPNVAGGLNANLAFYRAMARGGAFPYEVTDADMVGDVAAQEDDIRADVTSWMEGYLFLAYAPLSMDDLERCAKFSASAPGKALMRAQFVAFDAVYEQSSVALGTALARRITAAEL